MGLEDFLFLSSCFLLLSSSAPFPSPSPVALAPPSPSHLSPTVFIFFMAGQPCTEDCAWPRRESILIVYAVGHRGRHDAHHTSGHSTTSILPRLICWGNSRRGSESLSWMGYLLAHLTPILQVEKQKSKWFPNYFLYSPPSLRSQDGCWGPSSGLDIFLPCTT